MKKKPIMRIADIAKAVLKLGHLNEFMVYVFVKCLKNLFSKCLYKAAHFEFTLSLSTCVPVLNIKFLKY